MGRRAVTVALAPALALALSGCGSSGGAWQVVETAQSHGSAPVFIDNAAVARPAQIELTVRADHAIKVAATYTFLCGDVTADPAPTVYGRPVATPGTVELRPPPGPAAACRVNVLATKSQPATVDVTLRMRPLSGPSSR